MSKSMLEKLVEIARKILSGSIDEAIQFAQSIAGKIDVDGLMGLARAVDIFMDGNPIMPGVKMVEALAQCGAVAVLSQPENAGKLALFAGIDDVRFKRVVRPGDVLTLECNVEAVRGPVGRGKVKATVDGQLAVRGTLTFAVGAGADST